jgi:hypothetical protein
VKKHDQKYIVKLTGIKKVNRRRKEDVKDVQNFRGDDFKTQVHDKEGAKDWQRQGPKLQKPGQVVFSPLPGNDQYQGQKEKAVQQYADNAKQNAEEKISREARSDNKKAEQNGFFYSIGPGVKQ